MSKAPHHALLLRDGLLLTMNPSGDVVRGDLRIEDGVIVGVGPRLPTAGATVLELGGDLVVPGLVQAHVHLHQALYRSLGADGSLLGYLRDRLWPLELAHDERSITAATRLAAAELLAGGTVAVGAMETVHHTASALEALRELPLWAVAGKSLMDHGRSLPPELRQDAEEALREACELFDRFDGAEGGRLRVSFAPCFALTATEGLHRAVAEQALARGALVHTRLAEHAAVTRSIRRRWKCGSVEMLQRHGLLGARLLLAHGVHLPTAELDRLAEVDATVVHCPSANLRLGAGVAPLHELRERGIRVALGCDAVASHGSLDGFREMRTAALLQRLKGRPIPSRELLAMATIEGARALGWGDRLGSLEPGKQASLLVVEVDRVQLHPVTDPYAAVVDSVGSGDLRLVMVDGEVVLRRRRFVRLPIGEIKAEARRQARVLLTRAGLVDPGPADGVPLGIRRSLVPA